MAFLGISTKGARFVARNFCMGRLASGRARPVSPRSPAVGASRRYAHAVRGVVV